MTSINTITIHPDSWVRKRAQKFFADEGLSLEEALMLYLSSIADIEEEVEQDYVLMEQLTDDEVPPAVLEELDHIEKHGTDNYISITSPTYAHS